MRLWAEAGRLGRCRAFWRATQPFIVLEAGAEAGAAVREWGHVAMFSPWRYMIDASPRAARGRRLAGAAGRPLPTGDELVDRYVAPLATHAAIAPHVRFNARVVAIGRKDFDKVRTKGREQQPFEIHLDSGETIEARAVIDASGTWSRPNPAGSGGLAVPASASTPIASPMASPMCRRGRARYAGKRVLVVGSGHSAFNVVLDFLRLADEAPGTASCG